MLHILHIMRLSTTGETVSGLPFHFSDYLELVDWIGRAIREEKRGFIPADVPPILTRLGVEAESWIETVRHFRRHFYDFVGPADILARHSRALGRSWLRGVGACRVRSGYRIDTFEPERCLRFDRIFHCWCGTLAVGGRGRRAEGGAGG